MSSLEACIRKMGKALRKEDANAIRQIRDDIYDGPGNVSKAEANRRAVEEYIQILDDERASLMAEVERRGGVLADKNLSPSEFSKQVAETIETEARQFPMLGTQRGVGKKGWMIDLLPQSPETLHEILSQFDPEMADYLRSNKADSEAYANQIVDYLATKKPKLRYKAEDIKVSTVEKSVVDSDPPNPVSIMIKHGAQMERAASEAAPQIKSMRDWVRTVYDKKEMSKTAILASVPQTKLKDFIRYGMESVKRYVGTIAKMNAYMEQLMETHAALGREWLAFNKKYKDGAKLLGEMMHSSTLAGVDPSDFQMPSAAELKKMSKVKRAMWAKRQQDYEILLPFWQKLGNTGKKVTYEKLVWDAKTNKERVVETRTVSEAQAIYMKVRDVYANMRKRGIEALIQRVSETEIDQANKATRIARLRLLFESTMINPYFPLSRFGEHGAVAKDPETGETVAFFKRENRAERNKLVEQLRKQGYQAYPVQDMENNFSLMKQVNPDFVASVTALIGSEVEGEGVIGIQDEIWQMYLRSLPEMSVRKAFIHREGRLGFTHDALRAFGDQTFHGTHQLGKLKYGWELHSHLTDAEDEAKELTSLASHIQNMEAGLGFPEGFENLKQLPPAEGMHMALMQLAPGYENLYLKYSGKEVDDGMFDAEAATKAKDKIKQEAEHDGPWAAPVVKELQKRHEYNLNPRSANWATNLTALGFLWFLSTSPAAGVLNLTQTAISAYPILRAKFGKGSGRELMKASAQYATSGNVISGEFGRKLKNEMRGDQELDIGEKAAFEYFESIGMFAKTRTRDLMGIAERGSQVRDKTQELMEYTGYIFHKTEEANRMVTALAAYRLARRHYEGRKDLTLSQKHDKAMRRAEEMVEMSHYDYTNTNRPRIMQGDMGRVVFLFRNYSLNMQYRLARDFFDGVWKNKNIPKEARKEARSRFLGILGMASLFTGLSGMPMFWAFSAIASAMFGDEDEPYDLKTDMRAWMAQQWGSKTAEVIMKGPWDAFTGLSLSNRTSLNNLWIRDVPESLRGKDLLLHLAGEGLGPIMGIGLNYAQGFQDFQDDHTQRAFEKFVPKALADMMKTIRYVTNGAQTREGDLIMPPEAFRDSSAVAQFFGFVPSELVMQYEQNRATKDRSMQLRRRHDQLLSRLFMSYRLEDRKMTLLTLREITEWNKKNPAYRIDGSTIKRSAATRQAYDQRTINGVALDKRLQYLHEEMRFTPRNNE